LNKELTMKKIGRNDPCHCGSGKKFKKCCESKMIGGRYVAAKIDTTSKVARLPGLTGLFNRQVSAIAKQGDTHKPIRATKTASSDASKTPPSEPPPSTEKVE
jgi:hypothetical protein